jgi:toxin YhaV
MALVCTPSVRRRIRKIKQLSPRTQAEASQTFAGHPKTKLLKRILDLILDEIPRDPNAAGFQLGNTLGPAYRHWRRAKFLGRFRLFFRFSSTHKAIV